MGAWGAGLYENDTALDVKDEFEKLFNDGKGVQEITDGLTAEFESIMDCADEAPLFWLALADTQWKFGVLLPDVKENAMRWIDELKSQAADTPDEAKQKKALENLQAKLLSPLPPVKKPKKKRIYKCEWKIGDVFAYQLESDLAKERGLYGRYFLIQKVDEDGHLLEECEVYYLTTKNILFWTFDDWKLLDDATAIMQDDITKVQISKKDLTTKEELPGAELVIKDKDGKEIDRWISTNEPHYVEKMPAGDYTLTEITAPNGYKVAESIDFTVLPTGEIQTVVMKDAREDTPTPTPDNTPTPDHTPQPTPNTTPAPAAPTATPTPLLTIPKTGDNSSLGLLLAIAGISLAGLAVLVHKSARRKDIAPRDDDDEDTED